MTSQDIKTALLFIRKEFDSLRDAVRNQRIVTDISGAATALDKAAGNLDASAKNLTEASKTYDMSTVQKALIQLAASVSSMAKSVGNVKATDMTETNRRLAELSRQVGALKFEAEPTDVSRLDDVVMALGLVHQAICDMPQMTDRTDEIIAAVKGIRLQLPESFKFDMEQLRSIRTGGGGGATASFAQNAVSVNLSMPLANTEYSYKFAANTIGFRIKLRSSDTQLLYSWQAGTLPTSGTGDAYSTVQEHGDIVRDNIDIGGRTIYLQTAGTSQVAEIEVFTMK